MCAEGTDCRLPVLAVLGAGAGLWYAKENGMLGDFAGVPSPVSLVGWVGEGGRREANQCPTFFL